MAQVAFDYYSIALCSARRTRNHQGLLELLKLESSATVPQCASYHRRSTIRSFNWPTKSRVPDRSAQGGFGSQSQSYAPDESEHTEQCTEIPYVLQIFSVEKIGSKRGG